MYIGLNNLGLNSQNQAFSPASLFSAGEQGGWYDPSDLSTMYQDSAGTTPVTAVGQPVGFIGDKRLGWVRGAELVTTPGWSATGAGDITFTASNRDLSIVRTGAGVTGHPAQAFATVVGKAYEVTLNLGAVSTHLRVGTSAGASTNYAATGTGEYRFIFVATATTSYLSFWPNATATTSTLTNISFKLVDGNHRTQSTAASRPTLRQDANGYYYLEYDGVDDWMSTASVDFSGTDKMTVIAGVYKGSDAARGMYVELGTGGQNGSWQIEAPTSAAPNYQLVVRDDVVPIVYVASPYAAPIGNVVALQGALGTTASLGARVNGVQLSSTGTTNAVKFGNYPIYFGRRAGTTLPFNGREYGTIIRGAATDTGTVFQGERWMGYKMGIFL